MSRRTLIGIVVVIVVVLGIVYLERRGGRGTELNTRWFIGDWSRSQACSPETLISLKSDGSFTAPFTTPVPGRRALGVWSFRDGRMTIGNVFQMEEWRVERVSDREVRTTPAGRQAGEALYRCSR